MPKVKVKAKPKDEDLEDDADDGAEDEPSRSGLTRMFFRPRLLLLLAAAGSAITLYPRAKEWLPDLSGRPEYRLTLEDVHVTTQPAWIPSKFIEQAIERGRVTQPMSLLDDTLAEQIAAGFRQHPWVQSVKGVRVSKDAGIAVDLAYRRPVALVQMKQGLYPIDAQSILLPPADFPTAEATRYPLVVNVAATPRGPAGTRWGDVGVEGAARLAEVLAPHWKKLGLAAIVAPRRETAQAALDAMTYALLTPGGSRIVWGRAPETGHPGELSPAQKVSRLEDYLARYGNFDQPNGPYEIDIRHWKDMSRRPLGGTR